MDQETWRFINTFAPWAAALGTFTAAFIALHLARKGNRIALDVQAGIRKEFRMAGSSQPVLFRVGVKIPSDENAPRLVWIHVTNVGRRSATITHLFFRPAWMKRGIFITPPRRTYSTGFPITLDDGKFADYAWPLTEFLANQPDKLRDEFKGFRGAIKLRFLRVCVATSTQDVFRCRPEKELRELVRKIVDGTQPLEDKGSSQRLEGDNK
jgi:hypothetical protein